MKRIAFVIPWFGRDLLGGAEKHTYEVATRLAARGLPVEVLTTCSAAFTAPWSENALPQGVSDVDGVIVRRFPVDARADDAFARANHALVSLNHEKKTPGLPTVSSISLHDFVAHNINSSRLLEFITNAHDRYDAFVFCPYLYGPTLRGVAAAGDKAYVMPCLHDETYAYMPQTAAIMHAAKGLLFISEGEQELARQLFGPAVVAKSIVAGGGVEHSPTASTTIEPYVLYLGRLDPTKHVDLLLRAFATFRAAHSQSTLRLKLAGPGSLDFWPGALPDGVDHLGIVSVEDKARLIAACKALAQPSSNESYSRTMLEAWFARRPVLVHGDCLATRLPVERTQGGFIARTESEWSEQLAAVDGASAHDLKAMGERGHTYALEHGDWDRAIDRYQRFFEDMSRRSKPVAPWQGRRVDQVVTGFTYGDAVSQHALFLRELLRALGLQSDIYALHCKTEYESEVRKIEAFAPSRTDVVLYHHSIGFDELERVLAHTGVLGMIYHNITPASFFAPWDAEFSTHLDQGRAQLPALVKRCDFMVADSRFNALELEALGATHPVVIPLPIAATHWDLPARATDLARFDDGRLNILFVGRVSPNKAQHALLEIAGVLNKKTPVRLLIAGGLDPTKSYPFHVQQEIERRGLEDIVTVVGHSDDETLHALYRSADVYLSMSEHEGLGLPLVEAMWFEIPIVALARTAVAETVGDAGILVDTENAEQIAAIVYDAATNPATRAKLRAAQRVQREQFSPTTVIAQWLPVLTRALEAAAKGAHRSAA